MEEALAQLRARGYGAEATEDGKRIIVHTARGFFFLNPAKAKNFNLFPPVQDPTPPAKVKDVIEIEAGGYVIKARVISINPKE